MGSTKGKKGRKGKQKKKEKNEEKVYMCFCPKIFVSPQAAIDHAMVWRFIPLGNIPYVRRRAASKKIDYVWDVDYMGHDCVKEKGSAI
ncbi:hypothetical protein KSS87_006804 [Heliosperma pusillum]|nr:hypothetical protein KSS87_006804 [Heliosperma pusillum]